MRFWGLLIKNQFDMDFKIATGNIRGMCNEIKQNEVMKFIEKEKVQVCVVIETHLKIKSITKVCDRVFGNSNWISNVVHSHTCCRIVVGWNNSVVNVMVVNSCSQEILCLVEIVGKRLRFYCSFIYASNSIVEKDLMEAINDE
ncbi:RNA-directed DNA polymerase, eukaryota, Reverse transcriptase zinc-binding domain protein [Artemisia annua]|uniref:RNA-directed DNA polymerase, eukaryota, Reverse transcriptase zinc-binding domain protein n=1 Tax=Artemisia annua TaxID=35608 RepID=A0A2U1LNT6_ARTAN|nr:RNA-directed DNA polymerase, eukaryota, Reverse transcriptase zinc-binding domain protein [Artemisia annua]